MDFNVADLFEAAHDRVPERVAVVCDDTRATYGELERDANRLAHALAARGIGHGDHVGVHGKNCLEWVVALLAIVKLRAVPINVNYRYESAELTYLFDNADLKALVVQRAYLPRVDPILAALPKLQTIVVVEDGSQAPVADSHLRYADELAGASPERDFAPRSGDDLFIIYTGGTTGMPKGVMWRHADVIFALGGGMDPMSGERLPTPESFAERVSDQLNVQLPLSPLMHGAAQWSLLNWFFRGDRIVLTGNAFDADAALDLMERERVNTLAITGDAVARPLVHAQRARPRDLSQLRLLSSSAAVLSPVVKEVLAELLPHTVVIDAIGASEQGFVGLSVVNMPGQQVAPQPGGGLTVQPGPQTRVFDENLKPVQPGSGVVGKLARSGDLPLDYYKDPDKSAGVWVTVEGQRWSIPGDFARVEADGRVTLLGRGSTCINSGGEKIYPEEVEGVLKAHPQVADVLVVGVPDEKWGSRVVAVVQPAGETPSLQALDGHCRGQLAGYKIPRGLVAVDSIRRSPAGKPDYPWAREAARGA